MVTRINPHRGFSRLEAVRSHFVDVYASPHHGLRPGSRFLRARIIFIPELNKAFRDN